MVLHNTQAVIELAYEDAHASDEYMTEEESLDITEYECFCPLCNSVSTFVDGLWTCEGGC